MLGVMSVAEALEHAHRFALDLVEVSPNASPAVCKILDFGKFKYDIKRKANKTKKNQKISETKEMRFRPNIGQGDLETKLRNIKKFLADGDKVKISVFMKGREMAHPEVAMKLAEHIMNEVISCGDNDAPLALVGNNVSFVVTPNPNKKTIGMAHQEKRAE